ncbi:MAG: hypothetical protein AB1585_10705 [Thermodesulfobacteriota bacterium]
MGELMEVVIQNNREALEAVESCREIFRKTRDWFPLEDPRGRTAREENERLRRYIQAVDPPVAPDMGTSWAKIYQDRLIPSLVLVRMMARAREIEVERAARALRKEARAWRLERTGGGFWLALQNRWAELVAGVVWWGMNRKAGKAQEAEGTLR